MTHSFPTRRSSDLGEVERTHLEQQTAARPDHVRDREVDDRQPDHHEQHGGGELHTFRRRAEHERGGDRGESHLERSEEHTSELQSLMRISYVVFFLKQKTHKHKTYKTYNNS